MMMNERTEGMHSFEAQSGMTLIEVMVASVILVVGVLVLAQLQINAIKGNATARKMTEASNAASDRIEQIMSEVWTDTTVGSDLTVNDPSDSADFHSDTAGHYSVSWRVIDSNDGRSKTVNLTVGWADDGHSRQISQVIVRTLK